VTPTSREAIAELKYLTEVVIGPPLAIFEVRLYLNSEVGSGEVEQLGAAGDRWCIKISVSNTIKPSFICQPRHRDGVTTPI
jgi:hypothetical protein